jgi:hypothetical protein
MSRRKFGFISLVLLLALVCGGGAVMWGLVQVPDFYQQAMARSPDRVVRKQAARQFEQRTLHLVEEIRHADAWSEEFEQQAVNSWLAEELHVRFAKVVPKGVSDPRVQFVDDALLVGFHLEQKNFNGVVSLRLRPWVPEPNQLAIEVESCRAGLVPIPLDNVLQPIARQLSRAGFRAEWRQADGNDVLVLHLDRGRRRQPVLEGIDVTQGIVRVTGRRAAAEPEIQAAEAEMPEAEIEPGLRYTRVADQSGAN